MDAKQQDKTIEGVTDEGAVVAAEDAQLSVAQAPILTPSAYDTPAPDTYAVAIHVLRMAPAWLLTTCVSFLLLVLLLSWVRPDANASGKSYSNPNDSKPPSASSAILNAPAPPKGRQQVAEVVPAADGADDKAVPAEAPAQAEQPSPPPTSRAESHPAVASTSEESAVAAVPEKGANASGDSELKFTVQVGSHSGESSANEQVSRLRAAGFDAHTVAVELPGRGKWYRVQAGSFDDRAGASKAAALLRAKGVAPAGIVVPLQ